MIKIKSNLKHGNQVVIVGYGVVDFDINGEASIPKNVYEEHKHSTHLFEIVEETKVKKDKKTKSDK